MLPIKPNSLSVSFARTARPLVLLCIITGCGCALAFASLGIVLLLASHGSWIFVGIGSACLLLAAMTTVLFTVLAAVLAIVGEMAKGIRRD